MKYLFLKTPSKILSLLSSLPQLTELKIWAKTKVLNTSRHGQVALRFVIVTEDIVANEVEDENDDDLISLGTRGGVPGWDIASILQGNG